MKLPEKLTFGIRTATDERNEKMGKDTVRVARILDTGNSVGVVEVFYNLSDKLY